MQPPDDYDKLSPTRGKQNTPAKIALARALRRDMTPEEKALWARVRGGQLNGLRFRRQQVIRGFVADFFCYAARLVVEVDGPIHDSQHEYDDERDAVFEGYGLRVLRVTNDEVRQDIEGVLTRILAASDPHATA